MLLQAQYSEGISYKTFHGLLASNLRMWSSIDTFLEGHRDDRHVTERGLQLGQNTAFSDLTGKQDSGSQQHARLMHGGGHGEGRTKSPRGGELYLPILDGAKISKHGCVTVFSGH